MTDPQITITVISGGSILIVLLLWAIWYQLSALREIGEHMVKLTIQEIRKQKREQLRDNEEAYRKAEQDRFIAAREERKQHRAEKRK